MLKVCVCGSGTMGSGIAQVSAVAGFGTVLYDVQQSALDKAKEKIRRDLQMLVDKGKLTEEKRSVVWEQLSFSSEINDCRADLVIEAIVERTEAKADLLRRLHELNGTETIFASNTSSLSISEIAEHVPFPTRVAGLHFFNPAPVMKLVEVVRGRQTTDIVVERLREIVRKMGKEPVVCKDSPGFIVNRVARPFYIESLRIAETAEVDFATIDRLMENCGFRMGPFRLMDLIGNDINYAVSCSVYEQLGRPPRLKPSPIQKEKVDKGELGKKTGKGYYRYSS